MPGLPQSAQASFEKVLYFSNFHGQLWYNMVQRSEDVGEEKYTLMLLVANSTPMVDLDSRQNSLRVNRLSKLDFPTPESPISTTLKR